MSFRVVRQSKFRHVFGKAEKKDLGYDGIKISRSAWDSPLCSANSKFIAVCLEGMGGGAFQVIPLDNTGRIDLNYPKVSGHTAAVLDVQFCPYNDNLIASGSEDCTVKIWEIPDGGLSENLTEDLVTLEAHQRRVGIVNWHPLAENIILTAGFDYMIFIWDIGSPDAPMKEIDCHTDTIYSCSWNFNGSLITSTCKDKKLRVIDPIGGSVVETPNHAHGGTKAARAIFVGENNMIFTTGFSRMSERQYALWDSKNLDKPLKLEMIDTGSGVMFSHYDPDTNMVYVGGKGDGNVRFYEVTDEPNVYFLSQYQSSNPQRGIGFFPKTHCKVADCEVARMIKLHPKGFVEVIGFTVPRKSKLFQADIFPDTYEPVPTIKAAEWLGGQTATPKKISLKGGYESVTRATPAVTKATPSNTSSAPPPVAVNAPATDAALKKAYDEAQKEIADLKKQVASLNIKLKAAMNALDNQ